MAASLSRKRPSPLASGQPSTWAGGIVHVLSQLNFLSGNTSRPHVTMAEVCTAFGVGQSTASAKARGHLGRAAHQSHGPRKNPLVWMAEVNGLLVDLRDTPREVQMIAHEKGLIPYIPADQG
jgi:hypothetical protein